MPLTHEELPNKSGWCTFKPDSSLEQLDWSARHNALGSDSVDSPWLLQETIGDSCARILAEWAPFGTITSTYDLRVAEIRVKAEYLSVEFDALSKRWHRDTKHISLISDKIMHPAYLRIIGMGEAAIPLVLTALREKPAHWFTALRATANTDPAAIDDNPSMARKAWIEWGIKEGYID